jgi:hypothetical protein
MQTSTTSPAIAPIGRTDRPQVSPLSQIVAKLLQAPAPIAAQAQQPAPATSEPPARPDGRDIRLGSRVDIKV